MRALEDAATLCDDGCKLPQPKLLTMPHEQESLLSVDETQIQDAGSARESLNGEVQRLQDSAHSTHSPKNFNIVFQKLRAAGPEKGTLASANPQAGPKVTQSSFAQSN
mmetsp:Transcript_6786/g.11415  ORF Transcript_6786/g.11415 Transcript_6786/m.11415 type:complete len:108 (-) Transcript_6786:1079-1402(-)